MRTKILFTLMSVLTISTSSALAQASQTLTGTVSDAMCGKKHTMEGKTAAECTRICVKSGSDFALMAGDKAYILKGDKATFDKFAGANVTVTGKASGNTFTVESMKGTK